MARPNYVCTTCSEHFTRKYSAKRHNITVHHNNGGDIVPLVEYLVGRNSGKYEASHPSWYRRSEKIIHKSGRAAAVVDSMGEALRAGGLQRQQQDWRYQYHHHSLEEQERYHRWQQEQSLSPSIPPSPIAIQDQPLDILPYPIDPAQFMNTMDNDQITTLSQETILKIAELRRLMYRYAHYYRNPGAIIKCATYWSINGDNMILDGMLEKLRMIGSAVL